MSALLYPGLNYIGAGGENDIALTVPGVSRHHAFIELSDNDELVVEDEGSKNGTWVNGARVRRAPLNPGDWVQLGPVALLVEEIDPSDAVIAIDGPCIDRPASQPALADKETEDWSHRSGTSDIEWLPLLARLLPDWLSPEPGRTSECLADFATALGAPTASFIEIREAEEPVVLASWGQALSAAHAAALLTELIRSDGSPPNGAPNVRSGSINEPLLAWAVTSEHGHVAHALVVTGEFPNRATAGPALELLLGVIERRRDGQRRPGPSAPPGELDADLTDSGDLNIQRSVDEVERRLICLALARSRRNHTQAAALLGISRPDLLMKMRRLGINGE